MAAATWIQLLCGKNWNSKSVQAGLAQLAGNLPHWPEPGHGELSLIDPLYLLFGSNAMFQAEGEDWDRWHLALHLTLREGQRKEGDCAGSWEPTGAKLCGRTGTTALALMSLETYFRMRRTPQKRSPSTP